MNNDIQAIAARLLRSQDVTLRRPLRKRLYIGQLTAASTTLYTAPSAPTTANALGINPLAAIETIWLCNTDTAARTVTLYVVESGGSAADNRAVAKDLSIPAKSSIELSPAGGFLLEASDTLRGLADTTLKVTVLVTGTEFV